MYPSRGWTGLPDVQTSGSLCQSKAIDLCMCSWWLQISDMLVDMGMIGSTAWGPHYNDITTSVMVSQITGLAILYSTVYTSADQRKNQSSALPVFAVNSPHKGLLTRKMFPFDDVIMQKLYHYINDDTIEITLQQTTHNWYDINQITESVSFEAIFRNGSESPCNSMKANRHEVVIFYIHFV